MKKFTLIVLLIILISLAIVTPVLAGGDKPNPGKACDHITGSGIFYGHGQGVRMGNKQGRSYGPGHAYYTVCK